MSAEQFFEKYIESGQINDDTVIRMKTDKTEIVWMMEFYAEYLLDLQRPSIVGSSIDMEILHADPFEGQ